MKNRYNMTYIIFGIIFTIAGIALTGYGTFIQNKETADFQNTITGLTTETKESQKEVSKYSQKNIELSEKLSKQSIESQKELTQLSNKNAELTTKLIKISEERFRDLTKPVINLMQVDEDYRLGLKSVFKIIARNTGNSDCMNAKLVIDEHNSPLAGTAEFQIIKKIPKDTNVEYTIPVFQSNFRADSKEVKKDFEDNFFKKYINNEKTVIVLFHFEYEWKNETLKSSQFSIMKLNDTKAYVSSNENFR